MDFETGVNDASRKSFEVNAEPFVSFVSFVVQFSFPRPLSP